MYVVRMDYVVQQLYEYMKKKKGEALSLVEWRGEEACIRALDVIGSPFGPMREEIAFRLRMDKTTMLAVITPVIMDVRISEDLEPTPTDWEQCSPPIRVDALPRAVYAVALPSLLSGGPD